MHKILIFYYVSAIGSKYEELNKKDEYWVLRMT